MVDVSVAVLPIRAGNNAAFRIDRFGSVTARLL
jgi:hypothetical protein